MKLTDGSNELRRARFDRHLSQLDTAQAAGIKEWRFWRLEHGASTPTPAEAKKLAQVLRWPVEKLFPQLVGVKA